MRAAIGFTVKSGWAAAVLLTETGDPATLSVADSRRIELGDPAVPDSRQPYHATFGTAREEGPELKRLLKAIERYGAKSMSDLLREYETAGHDVRGAGVIAGSLIDPARLGNAHIRIHALEGQLFRGIIEEAVAKADVPVKIWRARDVYAIATKILKEPEETIRESIASLGAQIEGSWRAEQKLAALAAWLATKPIGLTPSSVSGRTTTGHS
jgi:hypothetical protein